jgi:hypothetical protein
MVTESGTVPADRLRDRRPAARRRPAQRQLPGGRRRHLDLFDLVGLLYAAARREVAGCVQLRRTGRSARRPRSAAATPGARRRPAAAGRDLRPRAHAPRPGRTAHQLAAVLTEYIGELATADPAWSPPARRRWRRRVLDDPDPDAEPDEPDQDDEADGRAGPGRRARGRGDRGGRPGAGCRRRCDRGARAGPGPRRLRPEDVPWDEPESDAEPAPSRPEPTELFAALPEPTDDEAAATPDPEATQVAVPAFEEPLTADDASRWDSSWDPNRTPTGTVPVVASRPPPPPPLEPVAERPLFAPEGTRRTPKGEPPRSETHDWATDGAGTWTGSTPSHDCPNESTGPIWPFGEDPDVEPDDWEERTRSHWLRTPADHPARARRGRCGRHGLVPGSVARRPTPAPRRPRAPSASSSSLERPLRPGDQARRREGLRPLRRPAGGEPRRGRATRSTASRTPPGPR